VTPVTVKKAAFRYMMLCSLIGIFQRFGRDDSLHCLSSHKTVLSVTHIQKDGRTAAHRKRPFESRAQILRQCTFRVLSIRQRPASYRADNKLSLTTSRHTPHQQCRYAAFYCPSAGFPWQPHLMHARLAQ
jgi:hypothetical protein